MAPATATSTSTPPTSAAPTRATPVTGYTATVGTVTAADLGVSWRPGCPVPPSDLRLVKLTYWGFDNAPHTGSLVVNASAAQTMVNIFGRLYDERFPIRRIETIDTYGASDDASTAADNTAAFNCRNAVADGPPQWSEHAYGLAIDVNPVENPYILDGKVLPPNGSAFADRSRYQPGMAVDGGALTAAFAAEGWYWGGHWASPDYQHFSANGG